MASTFQPLRVVASPRIGVLEELASLCKHAKPFHCLCLTSMSEIATFNNFSIVYPVSCDMFFERSYIWIRTVIT